MIDLTREVADSVTLQTFVITFLPTMSTARSYRLPLSKRKSSLPDSSAVVSLSFVVIPSYVRLRPTDFTITPYRPAVQRTRRSHPAGFV